MAFRVDDIVVTGKNVMLLSGGHQFVADMERGSDGLDSENSTRFRNPWNYYSEDGDIYHNLFDTESFDVRTQTLTGSTRHSPNNARSHDSIFMPNGASYRASCQLYGNAYTVTDFTTSTISSDILCGNGTVGFGHGFVRYGALSSYENPSTFYISPKAEFVPEYGAQYVTEYPLEGFYMDFGDNETSGRPTVFGDSVLAKYYLDSGYSVSSYDISEDRARVRQLRTYYDVGSTGNSLYLVFRNNLLGVADASDGGADGENPAQDGAVTYALGYFPASSIGYMSNIVTQLGTVSPGGADFVYSADPYSDIFSFAGMSSVSSDLLAVLQPKDLSFILYVNSVNGGASTALTYMPKIGLDRAVYETSIEEGFSGLSIVELPHGVAIGTRSHGILTVWSRDYLYDGSDTLVNFYPFQKACSGTPSRESLTAEIDGATYRDISLYYNGSDIVAAKATVSNELSAYGARVAFVSTDHSGPDRRYEAGQFFVPAGNPLYEIETVSSDVPVFTKVLSSVPVSSVSESTGNVVWNFEMMYVDALAGSTTVTSDPFQTSANYVYDSDILFDYSSSEVEGELSIGSYAFVQFERYGLAKCYAGDIYSSGKMAKFTSTGPVNRFDSRRRIWRGNGRDYPHGNGLTIRGKCNGFDELSYYQNLTSVGASGNIVSVVEPHVEPPVSTPEWTYFAYRVDGNTSSWEPTSVDYIKGHETVDAPSYDTVPIEDLGIAKGPAERGDNWFVWFDGDLCSWSYGDGPSDSSGAENIPPYSFFEYSTYGNLSSWKHVPDDEIITARVEHLSVLPGNDKFYSRENPAVNPPTIGDTAILTSAESTELVTVEPYGFWVYDLYSLSEGATATYVKEWTGFNISTTYQEEIDASSVYLSTIGYPLPIVNNSKRNVFIGPLDEAGMENYTYESTALLNNHHPICLCVENGTYDGKYVYKGNFYRYWYQDGGSDSPPTSGWEDVTKKVIFIDNNRFGVGNNLSSSRYSGQSDDYTHLTHLAVPPSSVVYSVFSAHTYYPERYNPNTFFIYGYAGNELGWNETGRPSFITATVDEYWRLAYLDRIQPSNGDIAVVKNATNREKAVYGKPHFLTFGINGNTSEWVHSTSCGRVLSGTSEFDDLMSVHGPSVGDAYIVTGSYSRDGYETSAHSFYMLDVSADRNTSFWKPMSAWSHGELECFGNFQISGYADSFDEICNLSGDIGAKYYTESVTSDIEFFELGRNDGVKRCSDATFSVVGYGEETINPVLDTMDFRATNRSTYRVTGRSALRTTYVSGDENYADRPEGYLTYNSFSYFPLEDRDGVMEPMFSTVRSLSAEEGPVSTFSYAMERPIEGSMGVAAATFKAPGVNHDAAVSLVAWNLSSGAISSGPSDGASLSGLHLQYNATCTDVYMNGTVVSSVDDSTGADRSYYTSTVYEYPHPSYGSFRTAGTGLGIFDGTVSDTMELDDFLFVNGYFVVKNYSVESMPGSSDSSLPVAVVGSGLHRSYTTGAYPSGGYVVTNFFADTGDGSSIPYLYGPELVESSRENPKTSSDSERFYDYNYLWHIRPVKDIEFYPESVEGRRWTPYYPLKHIGFVRYHNGMYYISVRSKKEHDAETVGYDIVETDTLFGERPLEKLPPGTIVSGIRFFGDDVAVEYSELQAVGNPPRTYVKWFRRGKPSHKTVPVSSLCTGGEGGASMSEDSAREYSLAASEDYSDNVVATYDNVEVLNSLNRFTPTVNHKSNLFSIRLEDLGFEESEYLTDYQKRVLRAYFRNSITELVDAVKPAHTQLFDVYLG